MAVTLVGRVTEVCFRRDEEGTFCLEITGSKQPPDKYRFPLSAQQVRDFRDDAAFVLEEDEEQQQPEPEKVRT